MKKPVSFYSEGCRLVGDVYYPDGPAGMRPARGSCSATATRAVTANRTAASFGHEPRSENSRPNSPTLGS